MFDSLTHALFGSAGMANNIGQNAGIGITSNGSITNAAIQNSILRQEATSRRSTSKKIFHGNIEVSQVANGYVVNIATREGYEYETHIAHTITEVNEIIAAAMVAFQLEK
jgi:hypothetical protein